MEYGNLDLGIAGLKKGVGNAKVTTRAAAEVIPFGAPVFVAVGDENSAYKSQDVGGTRALLGVAISTAKEGALQYAATDPVNVLTEGGVLVTVAADVQANEPAYITPAGAWTNVSTDNEATDYIFRTNAESGTLAELEVK